MKLPIKIPFFVFLCCSFLVFPAKAGASKVYFVHSDHLGSTSVVTDSNGEAVQSEYYYPFGSSRSPSLSIPDDSLPTTQDSQPPITEHQFTSQISDEVETGLYYYNARYYNPQIAKFTQADTAKDGPNGYSYVANNPVKYTDPTGHSFSGDDPYDPAAEYKFRYFPIYPLNFDQHSLNVIMAAAITYGESNKAMNPDPSIDLTSYVYINQIEQGYNITSNAILYLPPWGCQKDPIKCPIHDTDYQYFMHAYDITYKNYEKYLLGDVPVEFKTKGFYEMSHQQNLERGSLKFENHMQLKKWLILNFEYYKSANPGFVFQLFGPYDQKHRSDEGVVMQGLPAILIIANGSCVIDGSCGNERPGSIRTDQLDEQWNDLLQTKNLRGGGGSGNNPSYFIE